MNTQKICQEKTEHRVDDMIDIVYKISNKMHIKKQQRQESAIKEYRKVVVLETQLCELTKFTDDLADEVKVEILQAKVKIRKALKEKKSNATAEGRLIVIQKLKQGLCDAQDKLVVKS